MRVIDIQLITNPKLTIWDFFKWTHNSSFASFAYMVFVKILVGRRRFRFGASALRNGAPHLGAKGEKEGRRRCVFGYRHFFFRRPSFSPSFAR